MIFSQQVFASGFTGKTFEGPALLYGFVELDVFVSEGPQYNGAVNYFRLFTQGNELKRVNRLYYLWRDGLLRINFTQARHVLPNWNELSSLFESSLLRVTLSGFTGNALLKSFLTLSDFPSRHDGSHSHYDEQERDQSYEYVAMHGLPQVKMSSSFLRIPSPTKTMSDRSEASGHALEITNLPIGSFDLDVSNSQTNLGQRGEAAPAWFCSYVKAVFRR
jgi:hypothetical protein